MFIFRPFSFLFRKYKAPILQCYDIKFAQKFGIPIGGNKNNFLAIDPPEYVVLDAMSYKQIFVIYTHNSAQWIYPKTKLKRLLTANYFIEKEDMSISIYSKNYDILVFSSL